MDYITNQASMQISHLPDLSLLALHQVRCYGIRVNQNPVGNRSKEVTKEPEGRIRKEQTLQNHDLDKALNQRQKKSKMAALARIGKWGSLLEEIDRAPLQETGSSWLRLNKSKYPQRKAASPEVYGWS